MDASGRLIEWNDDKGFGFIAPDSGGPRLFVHVSAFDRAGRPVAGDSVRFTVGPGRAGRPAAVSARILGLRRPRSSTPGYFDRHDVRVWAALALICLVFAVAVFDRLPVWIIGLYAGMGIASHGFYAWDKASARAGGWRISEAMLHGLDAAFGIVGGLVAQQMLRHKTSKPSFAFTTGGIALLHGFVLIGVLAGLVSPSDFGG